MNKLTYILFLSIIFQGISNGIFAPIALCAPPPPIIGTQPPSLTACNNSYTHFPVYVNPGSTTGTVTYKWYVNKNDGNGWVPLTDGGVYVGTSNYDLVVGNTIIGFPITYTMNGYQYRAEITDATGTTISNAATLTVPKPGMITKDVSDSALICEGKDLCLTMDGICTGGETPTFQWVKSESAGWQILLDDGSMGTFYSGAKSRTLCINDIIKATPPAGVFQYYKGAVVCGGCNTYTRQVQLYISKGVFVTKQPVSDTICEGATANFNVTATGELLKYRWQVNPKTGTFGDVSNSGVYSGANTATLKITNVPISMDGYEYKCIVYNDSCGDNTSLAAKLTVTPMTTVSVSISPANVSICPGAWQNFTAAPVNGGSNPLYRWKRNGFVITGATNNTYGNNNFINGDKITCEITSSLTGCVTPGYVASNICTVTVAASQTAAVVITATGTAICSGTLVCFSATPTLPGTVPKYQWKRNGLNIGGATDLVYCISSMLGSSNSISVELTSNDPCVSPKIVQSNGINVTVTANAPVSVSISNPAIICSSGMTSFTATPVNGGVQPLYTWKRGGTTIVSGSTSSIVDIPNPVQGESITVEVTSSAGGCVTNNPATASKTLTVTPSTSASILISAAPNPVCAGGTVVFSATPTNGGTGAFPKYQWMSKGAPIAGATQRTYTKAFSAGDTITCVMNSNFTPCLVNSTDTSNVIEIAVLPNVTAQVSISASKTTICANDVVDFTATPQNPGSSPVYKWYVKGVQDMGAPNSPFYQKAGLKNNDDVQCIMTSDEKCVIGGLTVSSNKIIINVTTNVAASVSISSPNPSVCSGTSICFTAKPVNGGSTPGYQWLDNNGIPISGETDSVFCSANLVTGDNISCEVTSSLGCVSKLKDTSNQIAVTITPGSVASISISATDTTICPNTNVDFTAVYQNGGSNPLLQWQLNGIDIPGANSASFSKADLLDNDAISCILISNAQCVTGSPDTSDVIVIRVLPNVTTSISISQPPASICSGTNVNFTATPTYGGPKPKYQWQLNNLDIPGETNATFSSNNLSNNDKISCVLTSNEQCVIGSPATSVQIPVTVTQSVTPSVTISTTTAFPICEGTQVCFTANPSGGGNAPTYVWRVDGVDQSGSNSQSFCKSDLQKGQKVSVKMTSNAQCASPLNVNSNEITVDVNPVLPVSVTVSIPSDSICAGANASFTAIPVNGGNPTYKWFVNGLAVPGGSNSDIYNSTGLNTGDVVLVELTSDEQCVSGSPTVDSVTMTVMNTVGASVTITGTPNPVCTGSTVNFTATPVNGGSKPTYQWRINSTDISGATNSIFSPNNVNNDDTVDVLMTSDLLCVNNSPAKSDTVIVTVLPVNSVSVTISASANNICAGTQVCFTATPVNEGSLPVYQWKVGNANAPGGANSTTYCSSTLTNNEVVTLVMTSDVNCPNPGTGIATSNSVTMKVVTSVVPSVSISSSPSVICPNTTVSYTAAPVNGGTPDYQWFLNNTPVGSNSNIYNNPAPQTDDSVWVVMTPNSACATQATATSGKIKINVLSGVNASVAISASATPVCEGLPINFTTTPTNGGTPTYQWIIDGAAPSNGANIITRIFSPGDHTVSVIMTSNAGCVLNSPVTSSTLTVTVIPVNKVSVSITGSPTDICEGDNVTFSAVPINPGSNPVYQWYINQAKVGKGGNTFDTTGLQSTDVVKVELTSDETCPDPVPAVSNTVSINVTKYVTAGVTISTASTTVCDGSSVNFSAVPVNGGNPTYNWMVNGSPLSPPVTGSVFNTGSLADKDVITCVMTSDLMCVNGSPATSDSISITVNQFVTVSISINNSVNNICEGTNVDFTATPVNEGATPTYQWQINGVDVQGENNLTFSSTKLKNGDSVTCKLTSSIQCANGSPAVSNGIDMIINPVTTASVTITASSVIICPGASVDFTATPSNEGQSPTYQWKLDGVDIQGATNLTYNILTPKDGSVISCEMTSDKLCVTGSPATSNLITIRINQSIVPSIAISASQTDICAATNVDFTSIIKNGGQNPRYQWKINGVDVNGATTPTFSSNNLSDGDIVACSLSSDAYCATVQDTISNSIVMSVQVIPVITITTDVQSSCNGTPVQLEASGADSYVWTPDKYLSCTICPSPVSNPLKDMTYSVTGTIGKCSATDSVTIDVFCEDIYVPSAFTPNGDLNNDVFMIYGPVIYNFNMKIFSRWGELVFETNDQTIGWDGKYHNQNVSPGVYVWVISGEDYFGNKIIRNGRKGVIAGDVTLFR